jgi:hypothetical protein
MAKNMEWNQHSVVQPIKCRSKCEIFKGARRGAPENLFMGSLNDERMNNPSVNLVHPFSFVHSSFWQSASRIEQQQNYISPPTKAPKICIIDKRPLKINLPKNHRNRKKIYLLLFFKGWLIGWIVRIHSNPYPSTVCTHNIHDAHINKHEHPPPFTNELPYRFLQRTNCSCSFIECNNKNDWCNAVSNTASLASNSNCLAAGRAGYKLVRCTCGMNRHGQQALG